MRRIQISQPSTGEEEWHALREPLANRLADPGPNVDGLREGLCRTPSGPACHCREFGTTGLHLAMVALGIGPGDEVIVPSFTWVATANCVFYCGGTPVLADVDRNTFNIDIADVVRRVTPQTKAVIAVHLFGLCADIDALRAACHRDGDRGRRGLRGRWRASNRPAGGLGAVGVFSFHPRKSITTGEGGMVTTNDTALAERIRILRNHGASISEEQRHHGPQPYLLAAISMSSASIIA